MSRAWDVATALHFTDRIRAEVKKCCEECETDDPYTIADEVGRALLDIVGETYGFGDDDK